MLYQQQLFGDEIRADLYSKYQCQDRRSSASSTSSSGSNQGLFPSSTKVSCQRLANTLQRNWFDSFQIEAGYDDSLTNLNWLHNVNPNKINEQLSFVPSMGYPKERVNMNLISPWGVHPYLSKNQPSPNPSITNRHPVNLEASGHEQPDYRNNPSLKPPFSYAILISWAMRELRKPKITLADIYNWIVENFAYYRHADSSWQNSIRHNLSLGKCFEKVPRRKDEPGKGGFWRINPQHTKTLELNLSKIKYNPSNTHLHTFQSETTWGRPRLPKSISTPTDLPSYPQVPPSTTTKRPRKSPITVTHDDWDPSDCFTEVSREAAARVRVPAEFHAFDDGSVVDEPSAFSNNICLDLSPFDTSSSDSNHHNHASDNDVSMDRYDQGGGLYDALDGHMLLYKDDPSEPDDFRLISSHSDFSDFFTTPRDNLEELNCLLGIL